MKSQLELAALPETVSISRARPWRRPALARGYTPTASTSYQSVIRGGHIWLRLRLGQEKVYSQGDHLNALIALNQDSIERHAAASRVGRRDPL